MYNLLMVLVLSLACSYSFAGNCDNGSCRTPVRTATKSLINFTERVVVAPINGLRQVKTRVQNNRSYRRSNRALRNSCTNCN